jgi:hypothetical protein
MGILFDPRWKFPDPWYTLKFSGYQTSLDAVSQPQVMQAIWAAEGHFLDPAICQLLEDANLAQGSRHDVTVEPGEHRPEDIPKEEPALHFLLSNDRKRAFHFYLKQNESGELYVSEITWDAKGLLMSEQRM